MITENRTSYLLLIWAVTLAGIFATHFACSQEDESDSSVGSGNQIQQGKVLAEKYCGTCHLPVSPDLLDRETWSNNVLPAMAPKLGVGVWKQNKYYPVSNSRHTASISFSEWVKVVNYFEREAPESLEIAKPPVFPKEGWSIFKPMKPDILESPMSAATTMVKIDSQSGKIYSSNANTNALIQWDPKLRSKEIIAFSHPAVDLMILDDGEKSATAIVTTIGTMKAEDVFRGMVRKINIDGHTVKSVDVVVSELNRPLQTVQGDFNRDGLDDLVICAFGHNTGGLYLYQKETDQSYTQKAIRKVPGAERTIVDDLNEDGWLDLMVLFAHGDEGIWKFINDKKGGFRTENILRFPPVFGSMSFDLIDFDKDGLKDIILTNGDNADYSPILKPYHGLRIYLNKGGDKYEEKYFYPINGTTKAIIEDFDKDGDLDIATISFFADFGKNPSKSFIYFEQENDLTFEPYVLPIHKHGRWIAMDAADVDRDGDLDIVLGNFSRRFMNEGNFEQTWDTQTPVLLLVNETQ